MTSAGFLYIATGRRFITEAAASFASLKQHMPDLPVCCFTDEPEFARSLGFTDTRLIEKPYRNFLEKIPPLWETPFERTIFVDTDTIFGASVAEVFELLERFEIAAAPDPFWVEAPQTPPCFQHLNTGLIAYRKNERVFTFFKAWFETFKEGLERDPKNPCFWHDQVVFQQLLFPSDLRLYVLPGEYNLRVTCPQLVRIWAKAKMLHGRQPEDLLEMSRRLNAGSDFRICIPNLSFLHRTETHLLTGRARGFYRWLMGALRRTIALGGAGRRLIRVGG